MFRFFRQLRQRLLTENRFRNYFLYALGEIFLVVIGILIALQINTWNESRKEQGNLMKVYAQIQQDLQIDTLNLQRSIEDLEQKNFRLTDLVERNIPVSYYDTLNAANYEGCERCRSDITNLEPFQYLDKGYGLLKPLNTVQNLKEDLLTNSITEFYALYLPLVDEAQSILIDISRQALMDYQQYDWFVDYADFGRSTYNREYVLYIFESEKHRRACAHYLIYSKFTLRVLREYRAHAIQILQSIDEKLDG
ncbi:DUF6090 family protein [Robiginitalea marina]|uniref:DUF6090 family protein n=1 Tax=Robiginitalea marina TaxID=2954105 RepID=A0ABT1B290_9FLAO|nr:DUF6090 family protein [Robiginitalea marina]MCO5726027.1 DUF6090 family protein [Robiginitalea marina]